MAWCRFTVTAVDLRQTIKVSADLEIRAYYAGHVSSQALQSSMSCTYAYALFCKLVIKLGKHTYFVCEQVLGAAMFWVKAGDDTVVYTGDYNMTPDRHLGAAQIDRLEPDLLITE